MLVFRGVHGQMQESSMGTLHQGMPPSGFIVSPVSEPSFPLPSSPKWHQHEQDFADVLPCPPKLPATPGSSARQSLTIDPLQQILHISLLAVAACWRPTCDIIVDANYNRSNMLQFYGIFLPLQILGSQIHVVRLKHFEATIPGPLLHQPGISSMVM